MNKLHVCKAERLCDSGPVSARLILFVSGLDGGSRRETNWPSEWSSFHWTACPGEQKHLKQTLFKPLNPKNPKLAETGHVTFN